MRLNLKKRNQGFTIIEVLIVLAIAGLILAIVFLAVPQLQRNSRDNSRQNIVTRLKAELETYSSNNQGTYPFSGGTTAYQACTSIATTQGCNDWFSRYISGKVKITDPSTGSDTNIFLGWNSSGAVPTGQSWGQGNIWIAVGAKCQGENITTGTGAGSASAKQYATVVALDRENTFYCVDNG